MIDLGKTIKNLRTEKGLSQNALANELGVTSGAVCKWETSLTYPDLETLMAIANYFDVSVDYLLNFHANQNALKDKITQIYDSYENNGFSFTILDIKNNILHYPNSFRLTFYSGNYLYYYGLTKKDNDALIEAKKLYEKSIELISLNEDKKINIITIQEMIVYCLHAMEDFESVISYIQANGLEKICSFIYGCAYHRQKNYKLALEYLSEGYLDGISKVINCTSEEVGVLFNTRKYKEAYELTNWMITIIEPMSKHSSSVLYSVTGYLYILLAILCKVLGYSDEEYNKYMKLGYMNAKNVTKKVSNTDAIKFYYAKKQALYTSMDENIHKTILEQIKGFVDEEPKLIQVLNDYKELIKNDK